MSASAKPRFSIIIPNYNYGRFLADSVASALNQDGPSREVIVVDDCSTDDSLATLEAFGDSITVIAKPRNEGHAAAFNTGFAASRGEIVLFLDSDDYYYPGLLAAIAEQARPDVAVYQWRLDLVTGDKTRLDMFPPKESIFDTGNVRPLLAETCRFMTNVTSGLAFSRSALEQVLPMDTTRFLRAGDGYLTAVAPLYGQVVEVPGIHGAYRQHGSNHSQYAQDIGARARWRLEHDLFRVDAMRTHAARTGDPAPPHPELRDANHVQERLASLLLEPAKHPFSGDGKTWLAGLGIRNTLRARGYSAKYRVFALIWWMSLLVAPRSLAQQILLWRIHAPSRPGWIDGSVKLLRGMRPRRASSSPP